MNTKTPDSVVLHADANFLIQQGTLRVFNGEAKGRVLAVGLPVVSFVSMNELRAILAHEFAHFTGNDRLFSCAVLPVYTGLATTIETMDRVLGIDTGGSGPRKRNTGCMAVSFILPYLFLNLYWWPFHRANLRISRLRESRADVVAALTCGSTSFSGALRKVASIRGLLKATFGDALVDRLREGSTLANYCKAVREATPNLDNAARAEEQRAMQEVGSEYDSHPTLQSRLGNIPEAQERFTDAGPAAVLFANLEQHEEQMTQYLTGSLTIAATPDTPSPEEEAPQVACPSCGFENRKGEETCQECGARLEA